MDKKYRCRLCGKSFLYDEMSEEHYPARSVGNDDIVELDIIKAFDLVLSGEIVPEMNKRISEGNSFQEAVGDIFDKELAVSIHPEGRTARTLCRACNTFLGRYDEAYLRFFNCGGEPKIVKGFQAQTRLRIIKSIFGKFLSVPEAMNEEFDFIDFVKNESIKEYKGKWRIYFIRRDSSTDLMGFSDIKTGSIRFDEGTVYELSDEKFVFNLMDFQKHSCFEMTNIFDICNKNYKLIIGAGESGGYHAQILMSTIFKGIMEK